LFRRFLSQLFLLLLLPLCDSHGVAAGEASSQRDRAIVAELNQRPMIFFVAKGGRDACGPGCSTWIAADGMIDPGAADRFRGFLEKRELRSLPVFFNSPGGIASQSVAVGLILRKFRMTAGVGRTLPNKCRATRPDECRRIAQSNPEQDSRLVTLDARCASGCVYALLGASVRQIARYAQLGVHSPRYVPTLNGADVAPPAAAEFVDDELRGYLVETGNDPTLIDLATTVGPDRIHWLSQEEIERYHIETDGNYESPWTAHQAGSGRLFISKSMRQRRADGYYTTLVRLACLNPFNYVVSYRSELRSESSRILMAAAGYTFQLTQVSTSPDDVVWYGVLMREVMQRAAVEREIKISEVIDANEVRNIDLSTAGLEFALKSLQRHCDKGWGRVQQAE
jgi:hypothetical protein